ncbi:hypothetical protein [Streptomyces sp. uw30]|nr:hypothetical protein [Streptomyces sp. uw30]
MTPRPAAAAPRHPSPLSVLPSPTALRAMPADTRVRTLETGLRRELGQQ